MLIKKTINTTICITEKTELIFLSNITDKNSKKTAKKSELSLLKKYALINKYILKNAIKKESQSVLKTEKTKKQTK